ncbi:MAG: class I SAM-dependent methyltransferase [Candidatus Eiseniibacteriota bacterium]
MSTEREYVLGTHDAELERLGLQHRVWRPRASDAWRRAGFTDGQVLLDIGCGPGYATCDLAEIVGARGRVVALDRSRRFLDALEAMAGARGIGNIAVHELDLDQNPLPDVRADGAWSRWIYAFVRRPHELLERVASRIRPGGMVVLHEYVDYRAWRLAPGSAVFEEFVQEVMDSWRATGGEPDIGLELPGWLESLGFEIRELHSISEICRPGDFLWQWPKAFVGTGIQRLVDLGRLDEGRAREMHRAFEETEDTAGTFCVTPTVIEILARKR